MLFWRKQKTHAMASKTGCDVLWRVVHKTPTVHISRITPYTPSLQLHKQCDDKKESHEPYTKK